MLNSFSVSSLSNWACSAYKFEMSMILSNKKIQLWYVFGTWISKVEFPARNLHLKGTKISFFFQTVNKVSLVFSFSPRIFRFQILIHLWVAHCFLFFLTMLNLQHHKYNWSQRKNCSSFYTTLKKQNRRRNTYITTLKHKQTDRLFLFTSPSHPLPLSLFTS